MDDLLIDLELDEALADAAFTEHHARIVDRPLADVWPECLAVTGHEVRTLGPLIALRTLPKRLRNRGTRSSTAPTPLLELFTAGGFVLLRRDEHPREGRALAIVGAAGVFWSLSENSPIAFDGARAFLDFDAPGFAKTVASIEATDLGDGTTRIETETRVVGTDPTATRKFRPYWAFIRLPSGLIRRSWLAAIARRVSQLSP